VEKWMNAGETAEYLGISTSNLYSLVQQSKIPRHKVGRMWRFDKSEIDAWIRTNCPTNEFFVSVEADIKGNSYLRDPQQEGYTSALDFFQRGGLKAIIQLPVGCGKSGLISLLPFGIARGRVLVIAPNLTIRRELV
jgi:excisionase family DNA binding protein